MMGPCWFPSTVWWYKTPLVLMLAWSHSARVLTALQAPPAEISEQNWPGLLPPLHLLMLFLNFLRVSEITASKHYSFPAVCRRKGPSH